MSSYLTTTFKTLFLHSSSSCQTTSNQLRFYSSLYIARSNRTTSFNRNNKLRLVRAESQPNDNSQQPPPPPNASVVVVTNFISLPILLLLITPLFVLVFM